MPLRRLLCLLTLFAAGVTQAEIYTWKDARGQTHFGDRPPAESGAEPVELEINSVHRPGIPGPGTRTPDRQVIIYTAAWCGVCRKAKQYFAQNSIPYQEYDVEQTARGRQDFQRLRGTGVPIILLGDRRMNGFSPERFERLYQRP